MGLWYCYLLLVRVSIIVEWLVSRTYHDSVWHGPRTRYVKLRVVHAPGMPGKFSPPPISKETASYRSRHASRHVRDARAGMYVGIANPWWRGKRSRHSRRMRNPQFYVSCKAHEWERRTLKQWTLRKLEQRVSVKTRLKTEFREISVYDMSITQLFSSGRLGVCKYSKHCII